MKTPIDEQEQIRENMTCDMSDFCDLAEGFKALADSTRLHIIHLLMIRGEMCVCEFINLLDLTQSNISFHLKTLKYAGFITSRKEGKWMHYSLNRKVFGKFCANFGDTFDMDKWPEKTVPVSCENTVCR